jgi:hypothetical protein
MRLCVRIMRSRRRVARPVVAAHPQCQTSLLRRGSTRPPQVAKTVGVKPSLAAHRLNSLGDDFGWGAGIGGLLSVSLTHERKRLLFG